MTTTTQERHDKLIAAISNVAGRPVELTVRSLRGFTFSFEGNDMKAVERIISYFGSLADCDYVVVEDDGDCFTCVYVNVK